MIKKESATHLVKRGLHYVTVCSEVVDQITTPESLAIWVYLMGKSEGWIIRREDIKQRFNLGEDRLRRSMRELRDLGLIWDFTVTDGSKKIVSKRLVCESLPSSAHEALMSDFPQLGKTNNEGNPHRGKSDEYIKELITTEVSSITEEPNKTLMPAKPPSVPFQKIVDVYHEKLPMLSRVQVMTDKRKKWLKARWTESESMQSVDRWAEYFSYVAQSDFLTGRSADERAWTADFEWLVNSTNFVKVSEGKYHR